MRLLTACLADVISHPAARRPVAVRLNASQWLMGLCVSVPSAVPIFWRTDSLTRLDPQWVIKLMAFLSCKPQRNTLHCCSYRDCCTQTLVVNNKNTELLLLSRKKGREQDRPTPSPFRDARSQSPHLRAEVRGLRADQRSCPSGGRLASRRFPCRCSEARCLGQS